MLPNFFALHLLVSHLAIMEQPDFTVANGNRLDDMKAMIACGTAVKTVVV